MKSKTHDTGYCTSVCVLVSQSISDPFYRYVLDHHEHCLDLKFRVKISISACQFSCKIGCSVL